VLALVSESDDDDTILYSQRH